MVKIAVFNWNVESISLAENTVDGTVEYNRSGWTSRYISIKPDFFESVMDWVTIHDPDVVVFCFQEARWPGCYFHSELLPSRMPSYGYSYLVTSSMMGVGVTTYKNMFKLDPMVRGLITSVYVKTNLVLHAKAEQNYYTTSILMRNKGALAIYVTISNTKFTIINAHLPFNALSLIESKRSGDSIIRQNEVNVTNFHFNEIVRSLKRDSPIIMCGDFNYRNFSLYKSASDMVNDLIKFISPSGSISRVIETPKSTFRKVGTSPFEIIKPSLERVVSDGFGEKIYSSSVPSSSSIPIMGKYKESLNEPEDPEGLEDPLNPESKYSSSFPGCNDIHVGGVTPLKVETPKNVIEELYTECDEFKSQTDKGLIYKFNEGVDGRGPTFPPTCKMVKGRGDITTQGVISVPAVPNVPIKRSSRGDVYWNIGKFNQRFPSWCDRIIFTDTVKCEEYKSLDNSYAIRQTDHSAVMGLYNIEWIN